MGGEVPEPRRGMPDVSLGEGEFRRRFLSQFTDPAFDPLRADLDRIAGAAWDAYRHHRKAPRTRKAGPEFSDSDYDLAVDWIAAREREAVKKAQAEFEDPAQPPCVLIVNGSSPSEHTCTRTTSKRAR